MDRQKIFRETVKALLRPLVRWRPLKDPAPGFSVVLGTPWALRHVLAANLMFLQRMDLTNLHRIYVVFDRTPRPGARAFTGKTKEAFPDLPLDFRFHPRLAGSIVRIVNQSKFYASLNWVTGLGACRTRYAILHDFDLYPLDPKLFQRIVSTMQDGGLRFSGVEHTHFDGLNGQDALIGTWELGVDVAWIRERFSPVGCFHKVAHVNGRRVDLDAFSFIQSRTPDRGLADGPAGDSFVHVTNLCSTFLRSTGKGKVNVAWRLHFLWYLESLCGRQGRLPAIIDAMRTAKSSVLCIDGCSLDFSAVHVTCSNVLRDDLCQMEAALFTQCRGEILAYIQGFADFLYRFGAAGTSPGIGCERTVLGT